MDQQAILPPNLLRLQGIRNHLSGLKLFVRSVAEGGILRVFALAPGNGLGFADLNLQRFEL